MEGEPSTSRGTKRPDPPGSACKKRKGRPLIDTEKKLVYNVFQYVHDFKSKEEKNNLEEYEHIRVNKNECVVKTAEILGLSRTSVYKVLKEHKENGVFKSPEKTGPKTKFTDKIDEFTFAAIRRKVHAFFYRNESPTVLKILAAVNDDDDLPNFSLTTMKRILTYLNFKYMSNTRRSMLIERQDIISWRRKYLLQIKDLRREGRPIYYQDETWCNAGHTLNKSWVDQNVQTPRQAFLEGLTTGLKTPTGKGRRLIISHIGGDDGFVEDGLLIFTSKTGKEDYHQEMNSQCFEEWFRGILPRLKPNSVNHSRKIDSFPNMKWLKSRIIEWMHEKNLSFPESSTKSDLIDIAKPFKNNFQSYVVDEMARAHGMTVLRLPPYHCELNPIELVWAQVKGHVARNNKTFKLEDVKKFFLEGIEIVTPERWMGCINHIIKTEDKMLSLDHLTDSISDRFMINVSDSDDQEDDEITDDSESD